MAQQPEPSSLTLAARQELQRYFRIPAEEQDEQRDGHEGHGGQLDQEERQLQGAGSSLQPAPRRCSSPTAAGRRGFAEVAAVQPVAGAGLGVIALSAIRKGQRILAESPALLSISVCLLERGYATAVEQEAFLRREVWILKQPALSRAALSSSHYEFTLVVGVPGRLTMQRRAAAGHMGAARRSEPEDGLRDLRPERVRDGRGSV